MRQVTQAEREAMQRLAAAELAAAEAREHLLAVIRREAARENSEAELRAGWSRTDRDAAAGGGPRR
ncbi:MAG TPA: hypothetical protein VGY13_04545 [Solirubrobacteraceae bacterium]|nr:hypothetical protein [Solirubrobacteraceae bacterium]